MLNKPMAVLLSLITYNSVSCFADAAPVSRPDATPEERSLFGIVPSPSDIVVGLLRSLRLDLLVQLFNQLGLSGILKSTLNLIDTISNLPSLLLKDPVTAYLSLFADLTYVGTEVQQLAVGRLTCVGCWFLVGLIQFLQALNTSDENIANAAVQICTTFQLYPQRVCKGVVEKQKTIVLYSVKHTPYNLGQICAHLVGYGCGTEPEEGKWKVTLPGNKPPVTPVPPPQPGAKQLTVIHITDVHVDRNYTVGAPADCKEPFCCHPDSPPGSSNMIAGTYGGMVLCDTPVSTLDFMLQDMKSRYPLADFIFLTGDLPPHDIWTETIESHKVDNSLVSNKLKQYFTTTKVYAAIGNHGSAPSNNFPLQTSQIPTQFNIDWLYNHMVDLWTPWLSPEALATVKKGAYYSIETVHPGLRVISINNNICYFADFWLLINATDPMGELAWLVQELIAAETKQEKVIIIMHIPPGHNDCVRVWSANYNDIVNRFESTIVGQYSGHTHVDHFMVNFEETTGRATNVMYVCPSTTSYENFNVAYRVYTMDGTPGNYAVLNHETYILRLDQANANPTAEFELLYKAKEAYDMASLQPSEWAKVITKIETNDTHWQRFFTYYHRNSIVYPACDESCKKGLVCQLKSSRSRDMSQCPGFLPPL